MMHRIERVEGDPYEQLLTAVPAFSMAYSTRFHLAAFAPEAKHV